MWGDIRCWSHWCSKGWSSCIYFWATKFWDLILFVTCTWMYCFHRLWGIHLLCICWGWSAPIEVTLYPIDSYYSLTRGIRPLERIINSPYPGGLLPPKEDYHLSEYAGGLSPPREHDHLSLSTLGGLSPPLEDYHLVLSTPGDYHPYEKWPRILHWSASSLTSFPHKCSGCVVCLYIIIVRVMG